METAPLTTPRPDAEHAIRLAVVDRTFTVIACTPALASALGVDPDTVAGQSLLARVHPDDREMLHGALERARTGGHERAQTVRFRLSGGAWREDRVTIACVRTVEGNESFALLVDGLVAPTPSLEERLNQADEARRRAGRTGVGRLSLDELSPREREVLELVLDGYRVSTIARSMYLSPSTVRNHLSAIFRKFGVKSQAELVEELHRAELDIALTSDGTPGTRASEPA